MKNIVKILIGISLLIVSISASENGKLVKKDFKKYNNNAQLIVHEYENEEQKCIIFSVYVTEKINQNQYTKVNSSTNCMPKK